MTLRQLLLVLLVLAVLLPACALQPPECARADVFCAGLVTSFGMIDEGINREAWLGLQDARSTGKLDRIEYIESMDERDYEKNIAFFAEQGYDVIVTVGASLSKETAAAALAYPRLFFVGVEQEQAEALPNLAGLVFHEERSGFLAGALAALITRSERVAAICETKSIEAMRRYCEGFRAGARAAQPRVHVDVVYHNGTSDNLFRDAEWGRAAAVSLVQRGADVLFAAGGPLADAALEAAAQENAYIIGAETDAYERLKGLHSRIVSSAMSDIRAGVRDLIGAARAGQFPLGEYFGNVGLAPFHEFEGWVPQTVVERLQQLQHDLENGLLRLDVPYRSR